MMVCFTVIGMLVNVVMSASNLHDMLTDHLLMYFNAQFIHANILYLVQECTKISLHVTSDPSPHILEVAVVVRTDNRFVVEGPGLWDSLPVGTLLAVEVGWDSKGVGYQLVDRGGTDNQAVVGGTGSQAGLGVLTAVDRT